MSGASELSAETKTSLSYHHAVQRLQVLEQQLAKAIEERESARSLAALLEQALNVAEGQAVSLPDRETLAKILATAFGFDYMRLMSHVRRSYENAADAVLAALSTQPAGPMTPDEFKWAIHAERTRQIEMGYTPAHDDEQGAKHLINEAIEHARTGEPVASAALVLALSEHLERVGQPAAGEVETQEERVALIEACVEALTPMVTNRTHAWNLWNLIASDNGAIRKALEAIWRYTDAFRVPIEDPEPAPELAELFPGTLAALDRLSIRPEVQS